MADIEETVSIRERLLKERHSLLDLSTRNRLLNTPLRTKNNRAIEIVDEKAAEVFRLLTSGKALSFLPGVQLSEEERAQLDPEDDITGGIPQPDDDVTDERGVASRHTDLRLQTRLTSEGLQKRLFDVWYDAQTIEQEQGVNILYLAIGLLRWYDDTNSDIVRHAPLILLPFQLERTSAADRFKLKGRDEPPSPNLTLQAKLKTEFGISVEDFKDEDEVDLPAYCTKIAETVANQKRWEVLPDAMVLGFFSFSKFLMYRDLDPENWPTSAAIDTKEMITAILRDGFPESSALIADNIPIDDVIQPIELHHVVDADSSQTVAIAEAAGGRSLVVKGPPGTGKSQTITNIIASVVARGKKVLFVAEKMAALEVVHRRLKQVGLGPLTLELHSNKVNKRTVLEELKRTRDAQHRPPRGNLTVVQQLGETRNGLNDFAKRLHRPLEPCGLTPQAILGRLTQANQLETPTGFALQGAESWDQETFRKGLSLAQEVAERVRGLGSLPANVWRGVEAGAFDPVERETFLQRVRELGLLLGRIQSWSQTTVEQLGLPTPQTIAQLYSVCAAAAMAPTPVGIDLNAVGLPTWSQEPEALSELIEAGRANSEAWQVARTDFNQAGLSANYDAIRSAIVIKGGSLFRFLSSQYRAEIALLRSYLNEPLPKGQQNRLALVDKIIAAQDARERFARLEYLTPAFGTAWKGERSDWDQLNRIADWRRAHSAISQIAWDRLPQADLMALESAALGLAEKLPELHASLGGMIEKLSLHLPRAFAATAIDDIPLHSLTERLHQWEADPEGLSTYTIFGARLRMLENAGATSLVEGLFAGELDGNNLVTAFERGYADVLRLALFESWPELRSFDGEVHNNQISQFRRLDRARIELAQEQIVAAHANGRPGGAAGIGPLGTLNAEISKKRRHLPIRLLLERAGPAIQQLKPVFMMSPLSVAQFLKPGGIQFDVLVMDEASQIEPVDALGSIARAEQIVVVGDEKQLPPTAFFKKLTGEQEDDEQDGVTIQAKDAESILELCLAKGVPSRMLSWHYRSKHQSLIAVSNREFYENKLFIVPSPYDAVAVT